MKISFVTHPGGGNLPSRGAPWGSTALVGQEAEGEGFEDENLYWGFCRKEWVRQSKPAWDGLESFQQALGGRDCPESGTGPWGDWGRGFVA